MGFGVFMLICNLLIPLTMIGFGLRFQKHPPKKINGLYGYRTSMSMKNEDTWQFAHMHCGKVWTVIGGILLAVTVAVSLWALPMDIQDIGIIGGILCFVQVCCLIGSIFPTEFALKRTFDEDGNRK